MLGFSEEENKNAPRLNIRLSEAENQRIKEFCDEKGIKSKSKVGKEALNFALNGKSDIDFGIVSDFTKEERKTILFEDDKKIRGNCPHCKGKTTLDPEHYKKFQKGVIQNFIPGWRCTVEGCNEFHPNENYTKRPIGRCSKCYQFSNMDSGFCPWCCYRDVLIPISDNQLDQMNIPKPDLDNI